MEQRYFAEIYIHHKSCHTDKPFTYRIPEKLVEKVCVGIRVIVPFGRGNSLAEGYVVKIKQEAEMKTQYIKDIERIIDEEYILSQELLDLCIWMKEQYLCRFIDAVQCIMPTGITYKKEKYFKRSYDLERIQQERKQLTNRQLEILKLFDKQESLSENNIRQQYKMNDISKDLNILVRKRLIFMENQFKKDISSLTEKWIELSQDKDYEKIIGSIHKSATKQRAFLNYLKEHGPTSWSILKECIGGNSSILKALEDKGFIKVIEVEKMRNPYKNINILSSNAHKLTPEQNQAMEEIMPYMDEQINKSFLLHGITGSGKTEIYLQLIERLNHQGRAAILLVPEISLTTQMIERFRSRFGDKIAVLHSKLSLGERFDEWKRIYRGEVQIAIGARSAIFAPFQNLGMIIVDEEHEHSYKSDYSPKYHAVEVAAHRCRNSNGLLILGSATPSLESYSRAQEGEYKLIQMLKRYNFNPLPAVDIIDMREELQKGNKNIFSECLYQEMKEALRKKEQIILFLNRRGYATFISCRSCGYVVKCPQCEIALTYHKSEHNMTCHYCGTSEIPPVICPKCSSKYIKYFGIGTEKIEKITREYFPEAVVSRLDLDTTSRKGSMDKILKDYQQGRIDILIGTQMIAKGLDFPNVTLVGIIAADTSLNLPDFRASEKTFQLITQVSGRAGRGDKLGKVVVQTYDPKHFAVTTATNNDYDGFYRQEIGLRKAFYYPPFSRLINIIFSGDDEKEVINGAQKYTEILKLHFQKEGLDFTQSMYGPSPAHLSKVRKNYRWQLIIKAKLVDQSCLTGIINNIRMEKSVQDMMGNVSVMIDINPYSML